MVCVLTWAWRLWVRHSAARATMRWTALPLLLQLRAVAAGSGAGEKHVLRWVDAASGLSSDLPHARAGASVARYTFGAYDLIYLFGGCGEVGCF